MESFEALVGEFRGESDRAAAILAASFLDEALAAAIRSQFVDDPSVDELFTGYGPLSSFSARIEIAFALGLLDKKHKGDLRFIRKIRNHFAHHPARASFEMSPVSDWCSNFQIPHHRNITLPDGSPAVLVTEKRDQYLWSIHRVVAWLWARDVIQNAQSMEREH